MAKRKKKLQEKEYHLSKWKKCRMKLDIKSGNIPNPKSNPAKAKKKPDTFKPITGMTG